jgi:golgi phosphoprotein 3
MSYLNLHLYEEVLLMALRDEQGTMHSSVQYSFALAGAFVAELLLAKKIEIEDTKKKLVNIIDSTPFGDTLLDECLEKIRTAKRRSNITNWVLKFSGLKQLKHRIAYQLVLKGILRADEDRVLFFKRKIYPEVNPEPERRINQRLADAVLNDSTNLNPRTVILVALAKNSDMLKLVISKKDIKRRKARIEQIINGNAVGRATKQAIEAMQAAIGMVCIMPAVIGTSS